jgi:hypothetical protein
VSDPILSAGAVAVLKAELQSDLEVAHRLAVEAQTLFGSDRQSRSTESRYAAALLLHHVYSSLEASFERIAKKIDGEPLTGSDWHRQLLVRMQLALDSVRPHVISDGTAGRLDEYRRFRHVVRHAYEHPLRDDRLEPLVHGVLDMVETVKQQYQEFYAFLDALAAGIRVDTGES